MTINIFLAIFASVLFFTGVVGCMSADSDEEGIGFTGILFAICSLVVFVLSFITPNKYELYFYHWFIFIVPLIYIIILIWEFFTKKYILPWNKDYYEEYKAIKNNFDTLWEEYNKLQQDFENLKQSHQKEIEDISNKQSIKINKNNSKLDF